MDPAMDDFAVVKAICAGKQRRATLRRRSDVTLADLEAQMRSLFKCNESDRLEMTYVDSDGDSISVEEDRDVRDALFLQRLNPLRLAVTVHETVVKDGSSGEKVEGEKENTEADAQKGKVEGEGKEAKAVEDVKPERVVVRLRSDNSVQLQEDHCVTDLLLGVTATKLAAVVTAALHNRSSLVLEIAFRPAPQLASAQTHLSADAQTDSTAAAAEAPLTSKEAANESVTDPVQENSSPLLTHPVEDSNNNWRASHRRAGSSRSPVRLAAPSAGGAAAAPDSSPALKGLSAASGLAVQPLPCSVCGLSVPGPRYMSTLYPDNELCYSCFSSHDSADGQFVRVWDSLPPTSASYHKSLHKRAPSSLSQGEMSEEGDSLLRPTSLVHDGIECDMCRMCPIVGPRYKSKKLHDFDLCRKCYTTEGDRSGYEEIIVPVLPSLQP